MLRGTVHAKLSRRLEKGLAAKVGDAAATIDGAWVSHAELDGESDLVVTLSGPQGRVVALIGKIISLTRKGINGLNWAA